MVSELAKTLLFVFVLSLFPLGVTYADIERPQEKVRIVGEIKDVDISSVSFILNTRRDQDIRILVTDLTDFRSRGDWIDGLEDLEVGMKALVIGERQAENTIEALTIAARNPKDLPDISRSFGEIASINPEEEAFTLETRKGELLPFIVNERTRFRSREGNVEELSDLEPGIPAAVVAVGREGNQALALVVFAGKINAFERTRVLGEVIAIVPGQGTFDLSTPGGKVLTFSVSERTRFRSRDGTLEDIHDLKKGMHAIVVAIKGDDGDLIALLVAVGNPQDHPQLSNFDVKTAGRIIAISEHSFTVNTRVKGELTFRVDETTAFHSRSGAISGLEGLEVGMVTIVGATETDDGALLARVVGVGGLGENQLQKSMQES